MGDGGIAILKMTYEEHTWAITHLRTPKRRAERLERNIETMRKLWPKAWGKGRAVFDR